MPMSEPTLIHWFTLIHLYTRQCTVFIFLLESRFFWSILSLTLHVYSCLYCHSVEKKKINIHIALGVTWGHASLPVNYFFCFNLLIKQKVILSFTHHKIILVTVQSGNNMQKVKSSVKRSRLQTTAVTWFQKRCLCYCRNFQTVRECFI